MIGFKKVVDKYYISISPDISRLLPKTYLFVFLIKKTEKNLIGSFQEKLHATLWHTSLYFLKMRIIANDAPA